MSTISLCMIVKNEERCLARCLDSAKDVVDEIIIVDTGSTDQTVEIAKRYTDKIFSFAWIGDFSAARNYALDQATSQYILQLDADEYLEEDKTSLMEDLDKDLYFIRIRNYLGLGYAETHQFVRLFKNHPSLRYEGMIHEQINLEKNKTMSYSFMRCTIAHDGYTEAVVKDKNKSQRNMEILKEALRKEPSSFNYYNIGMQYVHERNFEEAIEAFKKSYALASNQTFTPRLLILLVTSLTELKRYDEALDISKDCIELFPQDTNMLYQLGLIYAKKKYFEDAKYYFEKCIEIGEDVSFTSINHNVGTGSYLAHAQLCKLFLANGDYETAQKHFLSAAQETPDLMYLVELFIEMHPNLTGNDFLAAMIKIWPFTDTERIQHLMTILYRYRHPATCDVIDCYKVKCPSEIKAWKAVVRGDYYEAKLLWNESVKMEEFNGRDLLLYCFITKDVELLESNKSIYNVRNKEWKWWKSIVEECQPMQVPISTKSEEMWRNLCADLLRLQKFECIERLIGSAHSPKLRYLIAEQLFKNGFMELALDVVIESNKKEENADIYLLVRDILRKLNQIDDAIYYANKTFELKHDFDSAYQLWSLLQNRGMVQEANYVLEIMKSMRPISPWASRR